MAPLNALRWRLVVLTAVAILPLAIMAAGGLYYLSQRQSGQIRSVGLELSRSVANAVDTELRGTITVLETLATAQSLDRQDFADFGERARRIIAVRPAWATIIVAEAGGTVRLDTRTGDVPAQGIFDPATSEQARQTRAPAIGRLTRVGDQWWFAVTVPAIRDAELVYLITALVSPAAIHDVIERQAIPADWLISIVDQDGVRVARSTDHEQTLGGRLSPTAQRVVNRGGRAGFGESVSLEGTTNYTPYSRIESSGWVAVLGLPTATVDAAAYRSVLGIGLGALLSIVLGTLGAGWVARGITRPIAELRAAAEALGQRQAPVVPATALVEVRAVGMALVDAAAHIARFEADREELLRKERFAREAAERADRGKDEFMAVLSHELRTPLNAVYGWARLLQNDQLRDPATIARAHDAIVRNADAQVRLIDDLLDLSRISTGKIRLAIAWLQLPDVLLSALDAVRPAADAKGVRISTAIDEQVDAVAGDAARLQQIVCNLLVNAIKFTPAGGEVCLVLRNVERGVEIVVSDTGEGIAPDMLQHVFDRFRQADSSSTRSHGGLGLGLSLVRHLVDLHRGSVIASSEGLGQGARFTVTLPTALAADTPLAAAPPPADAVVETLVPLVGLRLLVVDDADDARTLAATILTSAGAEVRSCGSAVAALRQLEEWRPSVLISDLEMPGQDGYSLIRRVRALAAADGGATPAIALSAYGRPEDRLRAIEAGFNMHVPKPVDPGELTAIVASVAAPLQRPVQARESDVNSR